METLPALGRGLRHLNRYREVAGILVRHGLGDLLHMDVTPFDAIRHARKPVVSAVNGICQGGGLMIAMLSDVAVASDRAARILAGRGIGEMPAFTPKPNCRSLIQSP